MKTSVTAGTSLHSSDNQGLRVFISYSRHDSAVADAIVAALEQRGFVVLIDRRDLPFGEKWQDELAHFIRNCETALWLVSERSLVSKWCNWELDEIHDRSKRLVPVVISPVDRAELPRKLGEIQMLPAEGIFNPVQHFDALLATLERDGDWLKEHTRLADRAREWIAQSRTSVLLLRGAALKRAESWKDRRPAKAPPPNQEVLDLILTSRRTGTLRQRAWIAALSVASMSLAGMAGMAEWNRRDAVYERQRAEAGENQAKQLAARAETGEKTAREERDNANLARAKSLAIVAIQQTERGGGTVGLLLGLEAIAAVPAQYTPDTSLAYHEVLDAVRMGAMANREQTVSDTLDPDFSLDENTTDLEMCVNERESILRSQSLDHPTLHTTDIAPEEHEPRTPRSKAECRPYAHFSRAERNIPLQERIARIEKGADAASIVMADGRRILLKDFAGYTPAGVPEILVSPDHKVIVTGHWSRGFCTYALHRAGDGSTIRNFEATECGQFAAVFNAPSTRVALASQHGTVLLLDARTGREVRVFQAGKEPITSLTISSEGEWIAAGTHNGKVAIWDFSTGRTVASLHIGDDFFHWIEALRFTADKRKLYARQDNQLLVVDVIGVERQAGAGAPAEEDHSQEHWSSEQIDASCKSDEWDIVLGCYEHIGLSIRSLAERGMANMESAATFHLRTTDGREIKTLVGIETYEAFAQNKQEALFAYSGASGDIYVINALSLRTLKTLDRSITHLTAYRDETVFRFLPDHRTLLWSDPQGSLLTFALPPTGLGPDLVEWSKQSVRRCLSLDERRNFGLDEIPPRWCFTGAGMEEEHDPKKWRPKPPYQSKQWREWVVSFDQSKLQGTPPPEIPVNTIDIEDPEEDDDPQQRP